MTAPKLTLNTLPTEAQLKFLEKRRKAPLSDEERESLLTINSGGPIVEKDENELDPNLVKAVLPVIRKNYAVQRVRRLPDYIRLWRQAVEANIANKQETDLDTLALKTNFHLIGPDTASMDGFRSLAAMMRDPNIQTTPWLVDQFLREQGIGMIAGPPKSGKSHFVRQLIYSVATGKPLFGEYACRRGKVMYVSNENAPQDFLAQTQADHVGHGADPTDFQYLQNNVFMYFDHYGRKKPNIGAVKGFENNEEKDINVTYPKWWEEIDRMNAQARENGSDPVRLVIIDPLANFHDMQENDAKEMSSIHNYVRIFASLANVSVVLVHHTAKNVGNFKGGRDIFQAIRGSGSIFGMLDMTMVLRRARRGKSTINKWDVEMYTIIRAGQGPGDLKYTIELEDDPTSHRASKITWTKVKNDDPPPNMDDSSPDGDGNPPDGDPPKRGRKRKKKDEEPPADPAPETPAPDFKDDNQIPYPE